MTISDEYTAELMVGDVYLCRQAPLPPPPPPREPPLSLLCLPPSPSTGGVGAEEVIYLLRTRYYRNMKPRLPKGWMLLIAFPDDEQIHVIYDRPESRIAARVTFSLNPRPKAPITINVGVGLRIYLLHGGGDEWLTTWRRDRPVLYRMIVRHGVRLTPSVPVAPPKYLKQIVEHAKVEFAKLV